MKTRTIKLTFTLLCALPLTSPVTMCASDTVKHTADDYPSSVR